jgi:hypothetical protein
MKILSLETEGVWEQSVEHDIWTQERREWQKSGKITK